MTKHGVIPDEWIVSYAAGALSEGQALVIASHAANHKGVRVKIDQAEDVGGTLIETENEAHLSENIFDGLLGRLDDEIDEIDIPDQQFPGMPAPLASYIGKPFEGLKWRFMGPGLRQHKLAEGPDGEKLWLLKAKGGVKIPVHDHRGSEMTLILTGSYHVGVKHYTSGLIELAGVDDKNHEPMIDEGEDCICLVVTEAPIKIHNLLGRIMQPFTGL